MDRAKVVPIEDRALTRIGLRAALQGSGVRNGQN